MSETSVESTYDLVVVGGGPGGYPAAIRSAQLGLRTALVEAGDLGGICLNWGCIPTKALLHGAEVLRTIRSGPEVGIEVGEASIDLSRLVGHSRSVARQLAGGVAGLLQAHGVEVIPGRARVTGKGELEVVRSGGTADGRTQRISADHIVLATGASPRVLPGLDPGELDPSGTTVWTYRQALVPEAVPESLVVIGSGAIGSEFASLYADLGASVTLLEALPHLMPAEPESVARVVEKDFRSRGIDVRADLTVDRVDVEDDGAVVSWTGADGEQDSVRAEKVMIAVGVAANTADLGLEGLDVLRKDGSVRTDSLGRTGVWGLYAVGDVAGGPCLAHKATHEGIRCVEAIAGVRRVEEDEDWRDWVPRCTYTHPEVASIGIGAETARRRGFEIDTASVPFSQNGRSLGAGETTGFAEVVLEKGTGRLLGANLVGAGVTELVAAPAVAHEAQLDAEAFVRAMIPHPSRAESLHEAVLKALGKPVNTL